MRAEEKVRQVEHRVPSWMPGEPWPRHDLGGWCFRPDENRFTEVDPSLAFFRLRPAPKARFWIPGEHSSVDTVIVTARKTMRGGALGWEAAVFATPEDEPRVVEMVQAADAIVRFFQRLFEEHDDRALRRAVSVAVEHAITNRAKRDAVARRAYAGEVGLAAEIARALVVGSGRYRGERKRRKAMRRLLRAAGSDTGILLGIEGTR